MKNEELRNILINKINKSFWWHVLPSDPNAYRKRGKFLASTYLQAEFYGKPNIKAEKVCISNPLFGFSEKEILEQLFPSTSEELIKGVEGNEEHDKNWYYKRVVLDGKIYKQAKKMRYDAIVLVVPSGKKCLEQNRKPSSIELNLINWR